MKEVEILVKLNVDPSVALKAVGKFAKQINSQRTVDVYYQEKSHHGRLAPDSDGRLYASCRIRTVSGAPGCWLAYKVDNFDSKGSWTHSDEYETAVQDPAVTQQILDLLGLEELITVDCMKHRFDHELFNVVIEEVRDLGVYLEVEAKSVATSVDSERQRITQFIDKIGLAYDRPSDGGKPEQLLALRMNDAIY